MICKNSDNYKINNIGDKYEYDLHKANIPGIQDKAVPMFHLNFWNGICHSINHGVRYNQSFLHD